MANPSNAVQFVQLMRGFRTHYLSNDLREEVTRIEQYATERPSFSQPSAIIPFEEREERVARAVKIEKVMRSLSHNPKWQFTAVQYAAILKMPLPTLRSLTRNTSNFAVMDIIKIPEIVKFFLKGRLSDEQMTDSLLGGNNPPTMKRKSAGGRVDNQKRKRSKAQKQDHPGSSEEGSNNEDDSDKDNEDDEDNTDDEADEDEEGEEGEEDDEGEEAGDDEDESESESSDDEDDDPTYAPGKPGDHDRSCSEAEKEKCRKRDGDRCILTGGISPDVCHIIPFSWNKNLHNRALTGVYSDILTNLIPPPDDRTQCHLKNALASEIRASNKVWNMIELGPTLHRWWSHGHFAFNPLGILDINDEESVVQLQFLWMPRSVIKNPKRLISLEDEKTPGKSMLDQLQVHPEVGISRIGNGRPVLSGHLFEIKMTADEAPMFYRMMQVQLALITIAAISGAADAIDLLPDPSFGDRDQSFKRLLSWGNDAEEEADEPVQYFDLPLREKPQALLDTPFQQPSAQPPSTSPGGKSRSQSPNKIQLQISETQTT